MGMGDVTVRLDGDDGRTVVFNSAWKHVDYGYAISVHRSQGITVDRVHVLGSRAFDRHAAYVAMTRHRDRLDLYTSVEEFEGADIGKLFSRNRKKRLALDYMASHLLKREMEASRRDKEAAAPLPEDAATRAAKRGYAIARRGLSEAIERASRLHPASRGAACKVTSASVPATATEESLRVGLKPAADSALQTARSGLTAARRELQAARALADAEKNAKVKPLSVSAACNIIPETADARTALREAADARTIWRMAVERAAADQTLASRLGFGPKPLEKDPLSGVSMAPSEGLAAAEQRVKVAAKDFETLCKAPEVQAAAHRHAVKHNKPIKLAREKLAELRRGYELAKLEAQSVARARETAPERARVQDKAIAEHEV